MRILLFIIYLRLGYSASSIIEKADKFFQEGKFELALIYYQKYIQDNPEDAKAYLNIGKIYYFKDNFSLAEQFFKKALELNPKEKELYYMLGNTYAFLKQPQNAIDSYQKALQLDKNFSFPYLALGIVYLNQLKQKEKTIENWENFLILNPEYEQAEDIKKAIAYLKEPDFQFSNITSMTAIAPLYKFKAEGLGLKSPSEEKTKSKDKKGITTE